jgi:transcriptional regulator with XRE-family HTH domain
MVDVVSTIEDDRDLHARIAERVRDLRTGRGLSLGALAERSGVSRSMISLVERGEASPTAVVLEKLAVGLDVSLAALFERPVPAAGPVARAADQPPWRDPGSGYVRRNVSPVGFPSPNRIVDVEFPPGGRVAYETGDRETPVHQQVWLLAGALEVTVGTDAHRLGPGDCLAFRLDRPVMFHNPGAGPARYAVVLATAHPR